MRFLTSLVAILLFAFGSGQGRPVFDWIKGGHLRSVGVVTSPDGKMAATVAGDGTAKVWRLSSGRLMLTIPNIGLQATDIDISNDSSLVAVTGWGNLIQIFRVSDGTLVRTINEPHVYPSAIDFSPDGKFIASCGEDGAYPSSSGSAKIWRISDGGLVRTLPFSNIAQANNLSFSPNGQHLAVAGGHIDTGGAPLDCRVKVFRVIDGFLQTTFNGHVDPVIDVRWHPAGQWIVSGGVMDDNAIRIWRYDNAQVIRTFVEQNQLNNPQFTPDGQYLINGYDWSDYKKVKVRRVSDWAVVGNFAANNMSSLAATRDSSSYLVSGDNYGPVLRQFSLATGQLQKYFSGHWEPAMVVRVSHNGELVASGGDWPESRINIWDAESGDLIRSIFYQDQGIRDIAFSPDDTHIVVGSGDSAVVYNVATGAVVTEMQHEGITVVMAVEYSPDGEWIATSNTAGKVRIWTAYGGLMATATHNGNDVDFSPDGTKLVSAGGTTFILWQVPFLEQINGQNNWPNNFYSVDWSPDGQRLVTGDSAGDVELWDANSLALISTLPNHAGGAFGTRFSPDGTMILTAGADARMRLIRVSDLSVLRLWDREFYNEVFRVDFSPSPNQFAIARGDGTIGMVNTFESGADSMTVVRGRVKSGGFIDVLESDSLHAIIQPGVTLTSSQAPIELELDSRVQWPTPAALKFTVDSSASSANLQQTVELYDFSSNTWTLLATRQLSPLETSAQIIVNVDAHKYIQDGTNAVRARIKCRQTGPTLVFPWQMRINLVRWSVDR
jgi:WD40 repeat protein